MSIGTTIKKLRRERDMTQEQLAEYLGISSKAVSQWECDRTAPDILQLPVLANIFEVSADVILGIDVESKNIKIEQIINEAEKESDWAHFEKALEIAQNGLKEYPNSYKLMNAVMDYKYYLAEDEKSYREVIELGEKILAECTDNELRHSAIQILCYTYPNIGETEKAVALANTMPSRMLTCGNLLCMMYSGTKRFEEFRKALVESIQELYMQMNFSNAPLDDGTYPYLPEEKTEIYKKYLAIIEILFEDGNYGFFSESVASVNLCLSEHSIREGERCDDALEYLKTAAYHAVFMDTEYDPKSKYSCLLLRGLEFGKISYNSTENHSYHLLDHMHESLFDPIRNRPEFIEIENKLKQYAKHR